MYALPTEVVHASSVDSFKNKLATVSAVMHKSLFLTTALVLKPEPPRPKWFLKYFIIDLCPIEAHVQVTGVRPVIALTFTLRIFHFVLYSNRPNKTQTFKFLYTLKCTSLRVKCTKIVVGRGSAPDPAGGAYNAPPDR